VQAEAADTAIATRAIAAQRELAIRRRVTVQILSERGEHIKPVIPFSSFHMDRRNDVMAILKLYELRRDEQMRAARQWYFSDFAPRSAMDIVSLYRDGERASSNFRMVVSFWDTASSLVLNGGIDTKNVSRRQHRAYFCLCKDRRLPARGSRTIYANRISSFLSKLFVDRCPILNRKWPAKNA